MRQVAAVEKDQNKPFIEGFLEDCNLRGLADETIENYLSMLRVFNEFLDGQPVQEVKREELLAFLQYLREERGVSGKRVRNYFYALSSFYEYLVFKREIEKNPVTIIKKRYLKRYKNRDSSQERKLISVEEMSKLVNSTLDIRAKAIITLLAKTGIRRGELLAVDVEDVDWEAQSIVLKKRKKRSNCVVFFDNECSRVLQRWMELRRKLSPKTKALFVSQYGNRADKNVVYKAVTKNAEKIGLHDSDSDRMKDHFSPHCCRHWFTTHLLRNGMRRDYVKELRGDVRNEAIDIYHHIDREELRRAYLAHIPQLGL